MAPREAKRVRFDNSTSFIPHFIRRSAMAPYFMLSDAKRLDPGNVQNPHQKKPSGCLK
jgi:hypothetical protein